MKQFVLVAVLVASGSALVLAGIPSAEAGSGYRGGGGGHRHHGHHGHYRPYYSRVVIAAPFYAYPRYYYPAPAYYAPASAPAPVYVEQSEPVAAPLAQGDWYYCSSARAYYPQVPTCAEQWLRVAPRQ